MFKHHTLLYLGAISLFMTLSSCNGNNKEASNGKKFNPTERQSKFTDEERAEAIAAKRAELDSMQLDIDKLVFENNVKLTVLPPNPTGDVSPLAAQTITAKMMQIVSENGLGGYGNSPAFCLATVLTPTSRIATGTAPQRMLCKYTITFVVGNMLTSDIYATYDMDIEGVGRSFEEATNNIASSIRNERGLQEMLKKASDRILAWYNENPQRFKSTVESFVAKQDYATAYALLTTVPEKATACFKYAVSRQGQVLEEMKNQKAENLLSDLRNAIAAAGSEYSPMVAGCLQLIPARSKQYAEGKKLYDGYVAHVRAVKRDSIKHEQQMELERLAMEKMKLKYEQEAAMRAAQKALTPPKGESATNIAQKTLASSSSNNSGSASGGSSFSGSRLVNSIKEHPFLWGLGAGAVAMGAAGVGLYAALPFTTKLGLALL